MITKLRNLTLFVYYALKHNIRFEDWPRAWREVKAAHLAQTRKAIWELKKEGKIHEDKQGYLWAKKE